jgi:uncharacterized membrane protein YfcA
VENLINLIITGLIIGFLSGLFGIGGSIISTPVLKTIFSLPDFIALATPLPVIIPTAVAGTYNYWKSGKVRKDIAFWTIISGLPFTILGAFGTKIASGKFLMILTGLFVVITGLRILSNRKLIASDERKLSLKTITILTGLVAGFVSGFLAVGGGIILVPAYILLLGLTMQEAASTSLFCIAFFAVPGTAVHAYLNHIDWIIAACLTVGVIPSSFIGSKVALKIKSDKLKHAFAGLLILMGIYFIIFQIKA